MILGFYSEQADAYDGHTVWTTPSGNQVTVTRFFDAAEPAYGQGPPDEVSRGEIVAIAPSGRTAVTFKAGLCVVEPAAERPRPSAAHARPEDDDGA